MSASRLLLLAAVGTTVLIAAAVALATVVKKRRRNPVPKRWKEVGEVTKLYVYPCKSLMAVPVLQFKCTTLGASHGKMRDRVLLVVDGQNNFVTQRQQPKMVLIRLTYQDDYLCLDAPDMATIQVKIPDSPRVNCRIWADRIDKVIDCGDEVATWLSTFLLGQPEGRRLLYYPWKYSKRKISARDSLLPNWTEHDKGAFPDATSYHMLTEESVEDLNTRLQSPVTHLNFRPNVLIRGSKPYDEDNWKWMQIGSAIFRTVHPCTRCLLTTVNPETGIKDAHSEPLATLKSYRMPTDPLVLKACGPSPMMGLNMALEGVGDAGDICVGDKVFVGCDDE